MRLSLGPLRIALYLFMAVGRASALGIPAGDCVQPFTTQNNRVWSCRIQDSGCIPKPNQQPHFQVLCAPFLVSTAQYLTKIIKGRSVWTHGLRRYRAHHAGKAWQQECEGDGHIVSILRKLKEVNADAQLSFFTVLILGSSHRMMSSTFTVGLP